MLFILPIPTARDLDRQHSVVYDPSMMCVVCADYKETSVYLSSLVHSLVCNPSSDFALWLHISLIWQCRVFLFGLGDGSDVCTLRYRILARE